MNTENRRILIIDDNEAIHDDFRKVLGQRTRTLDTVAERAAALFDGERSPASLENSYEIDSALQGREGVEKVRQSLVEQRPYALVFVDGRMPPGWDGIETVARLWQVDPHLQIVICTAYCDYTWEDIVGKLGATDQLLILKKPFDNIEVCQLAFALVAKWNFNWRIREELLPTSEVEL